MTTYKEIKGTQIEVLESDPSNPVEGQVWYNSTSNVLKGAAATTSGAWSSGGNLNTGRRQMAGAGTSSSAALGFGGYLAPPPAAPSALCESYNGTSWTEVNDLNSAKTVCTTTGTQTAAILFGGTPAVAETEHYNGSTWTEVGDLNTGRYEMAAAGGYTAGLAFTGRTPGTT